MFTLEIMKIVNLFCLNSRKYSLCRFSPIEILSDDSKEKSQKSICRSRPADNVTTRSFFNFPNAGQTKEYSGRKLVGYSAEQMFNVVADVDNYHAFIPFCKKSVVTSRTPHSLRADLVIGFPPLVERYTSRVVLVRPTLVKASAAGKLFNHLLTVWRFSPGLKNNPGTSVIDFFVSFEFRSSLHSQLAHMFFNELVRQMEGAFYEEAKKRYGKPAIKTQLLRPQNRIES